MLQIGFALWMLGMMGLQSGLPGASDCDQLFAPDAFLRHVQFLGSDALQGRATGSPGSIMAAEYIANHLQRSGLKGGIDGAFFQSVPMHGSVPLPTCILELSTPDGGDARRYRLEQDYLIYRGGSHTFIPQPLPLVFVGYGIIAPEFDYNDYQRVDVTGKIVVFLSGEPLSDDADYFLGRARSVYAHAESKQRLAISRGARGSILIPSPNQGDPKPWEDWQLGFAFEDIRLAYESSSHLSMVMNRTAAEDLFAGSGMSLSEVFAREHDKLLTSFELRRKLRFQGEFRERDFIDRNVVAVLPGRDAKLKDTCVVLSAHYDHLGIGPEIQGDRIYNGVLDNAVGVSALLEIAQALSLETRAPTRSIVFLFATGEEKGLLGTSYYVENPAFPLYKTIANVNIDGLAVNDTFDDMFGFGASYSTLSDRLERILGHLDLTLSDVPHFVSQADSFARSDQMAFARVGVPSVILVEGFQHHHQTPQQAFARWVAWQNETYHTPFDDLTQPINLDACMQHLCALYAVAFDLANSRQAPKWHPGSRFAHARLLTQVEKR